MPMKKYIRIMMIALTLLTMLSAVISAFAEGQPSLVLDRSAMTLDKGKTQKLKYTLENVEKPKKAKVTWESSDTAVATVKGGAVKAVDAGEAVITCTATLEDGNVLTATASVKVVIPVKGIKILTKANTAVPSGRSFPIEYAIQPENATDQTVAWQSSNEQVMTIGEDGTATALAEGKVQITAETANGKKAKLSLTVTPYAPDIEAVIQKAAYNPEDRTLKVTWKNHGTQTITGLDLRICPLDAEGNILLFGEGEEDELILEQRVFHLFPQAAAGDTVNSAFPIGKDYAAADNILITVMRIVHEDGSEIVLPDDRLCWYSLKGNAYVGPPENSEPYAVPSEETLAAAQETRFGFSAAPLYGETAPAYGYAHSGFLILEIEAGSPAEEMGLAVGDLIFSVNDTPYSREPYLMTLAAAELAQNRPVNILIEREDEILELTIEPDGDETEEPAEAAEPETAEGTDQTP